MKTLIIILICLSLLGCKAKTSQENSSDTIGIQNVAFNDEINDFESEDILIISLEDLDKMDKQQIRDMMLLAIFYRDVEINKDDIFDKKLIEKLEIKK